MNIFLCGSNQLTALDQEEIKKFLTDYAHKHKIYILCYKSIENEVLRFFRLRMKDSLKIYAFTRCNHCKQLQMNSKKSLIT